MDLIKYDAPNVPSIQQESVNGFDISHNPDDNRWYVCDWNCYGDLVTRATFNGDRKGFHNARYFATTHVAHMPPD